MKCAHRETVTGLSAVVFIGRDGTKCRPADAVFSRCRYCGSWLSLGPSNDVGLEIEIVLAAHLQENALLFEPNNFRDQANEIAINAVLVAWESP